MKMTVKLGVAALAAAGCLMMTTYAAAQEAGAQGGGEVGMALPGAQPTQAAAAQGESDHDAMIGRLAIGYMGAFQIPISTGGDINTGPGQGNVTAPAIGIRYWIDQMIGLDIGLGFSNTSGSTKGEQGGNSVEVEDPSVTGFLIHGGLPLSLTSAGHFSFQLVPEVNVGFATSTYEQGNITDDRTGILFELGARAGAEIHFGFMGIPELSLQAGVGAHFATRQWKSVIKQPNVPDLTLTRNETVIETTVNNNPWDIFTGNISALYYF